MKTATNGTKTTARKRNAMDDAIAELKKIAPCAFDETERTHGYWNDFAARVDGGQINIDETVCDSGVDDDGTEYMASSITIDCMGSTHLLLHFYRDADIMRLAAVCLKLLHGRDERRAARQKAARAA